MACYTFITDFRGGTYISQIQAIDLPSACVLWRDEIADGGYVEYLDRGQFIKAFNEDIDEMPPAAIEGLQHVWLLHVIMEPHVLDAHIVETNV
jgi:hypothetical protein